MKRLVAVTGGTGFVGSHAVEALLADGYPVRALVRRPDAPGWLKGLPVDLVPGDITRPETLTALVDGAGAVLHIAGRTSARNEAEYMAANAGGTANLLEATRRAAPGADFHLVSSLAAAGPCVDGAPARAEDGRPVSSYGRSKLAGERVVRESGLPFTILRPVAVYGPRETAIRDLFVAASRGVVPVLAGGRPKIQLVYAKDLALAISRAVARGSRGETLFAAHPETLDYGTLARVLASLRTPPARLVPVPAALIRLAGVAVGWASVFKDGPPVFNSEKATEMLQPAWLCDTAVAQEALGDPFTTSFRAGARETWNWYAQAGWISA